MKQVQIGKQTDISITDSEIWYTFVMADGRQYHVGFESTKMLSYLGKNYEVLEDGGLFRIAIPE